MNTPEQHILNEWDSICANANKALHSDCPLAEAMYDVSFSAPKE